MRGHDVTVIAPFPSRPEGQVFPGFRRRLFVSSRESGGIRVIRCFSAISRAARLVSRLSENVSFGLSGGLAMAMMRRPDVVYANTWPIFASGITALVALFRRIPIVVSVQDVYPESLFSLGRLRKGSFFARLMRFVDARIAHLASGIIVISPRVEQIYLTDRGIPPERVHLIANWRESEPPPALETVGQRRDGWKLNPGTFLFLFAGNVAAACGVEDVIEAISNLSAESSAQLVIAGSGGALEKCRSIASHQVSQRTVFCGSFPARETLAILSAADVLILPTQGDQSLVSMPSKLISYMLAARPVLAIARLESDLARLVNESGCGWVVEPGAPEQLSRQMSAVMAMDRSVLAHMGSLGREYALAHFSTEVCLPKVIGVIEQALTAKQNLTGAQTYPGQRA